MNLLLRTTVCYRHQKPTRAVRAMATQIKNATHVTLEHFKGCLLGALLGDCLGAEFEGRENVSLGHFEMFFINLQSEDFLDEFNPGPLNYTDDTAMLKSVAESLISNKGFDAADMAKRFVSEYYQAPNRGYGGSVVDVFAKLKQSRSGSDPFAPAREQFNGSGSYGNGGAMRIASVPLFYHGDYTKMLDIVAQVTKLTHTHRLAIHGALLQSIAVHQALCADRSKSLEPTSFLAELKDKMAKIEESLEPDEEETYVKKIERIEHLLADKDTKDIDVIDSLGHGVAAYESVPTAVYAFLRALQPIAHLPGTNVVTRTIKYAITLGGDTDTIAAMSGAIAGAYYGNSSIEPGLLRVVEARGYIESVAQRLYESTEACVLDEPER